MDKHELVCQVKKLADELGRVPSREELMASGATDWGIRTNGGYLEILKLAGMGEAPHLKKRESHNPKILLFDIETAPIMAYVWGLWDQNVAINQIIKDWHILSWAAKWLDSDDIFYEDQRNEKNVEDDAKILKKIHRLLDEADIVITQNGVKFDRKKLNARFIKIGLPPPSSFRHVDTLKIARKHFSFTSNKLEFLAEFLGIKCQKLKHKKYPGFMLWVKCMAGVKDAWDEMKKYNIGDIMALEGVYYRLRIYEPSINFNVFHDFFENYCQCGGQEFKEKGFEFTNRGKFQRYQCEQCGTHYVDKNNKLSTKKREAIRRLQ